MKLTESEWQIMNALWAKHPATARQIAERLPKGVEWAYTTIKTLLSRLVEKNVVRDIKQKNVSFYEPILSRQDARKNALWMMLDHAFEGALGPLMHFLTEDENLSTKEKQELIKILQEGKQKGDQSCSS
jgi:BlaI family penicillinase repressor